MDPPIPFCNRLCFLNLTIFKLLMSRRSACSPFSHGKTPPRYSTQPLLSVPLCQIFSWNDFLFEESFPLGPRSPPLFVFRPSQNMFFFSLTNGCQRPSTNTPRTLLHGSVPPRPFMSVRVPRVRVLLLSIKSFVPRVYLFEPLSFLFGPTSSLKAASLDLPPPHIF